MMTERDSRTGVGVAEVRRRHIPVLLSQVLAAIEPVARATIIDGTFGAGGYTRAMLEAGAGRVIAIDRDPNAVASGQWLIAEFPGRLDLVHARFGALDDVARHAGADAADAVVLDIGVSSMQLDEPGRGFSFQHDGPLDMRMSTRRRLECGRCRQLRARGGHRRHSLSSGRGAPLARHRPRHRRCA